MSKKQSDQLDKLLAEAVASSKNVNIIQSQEGRACVSLIIRLIEIVRFGEAKTQPETRNHG